MRREKYNFCETPTKVPWCYSGGSVRCLEATQVDFDTSKSLRHFKITRATFKPQPSKLRVALAHRVLQCFGQFRVHLRPFWRFWTDWCLGRLEVSRSQYSFLRPFRRVSCGHFGSLEPLRPISTHWSHFSSYSVHRTTPVPWSHLSLKHLEITWLHSGASLLKPKLSKCWTLPCAEDN
jgi:hypothetical protein